MKRLVKKIEHEVLYGTFADRQDLSLAGISAPGDFKGECRE